MLLTLFMNHPAIANSIIFTLMFLFPALQTVIPQSSTGSSYLIETAITNGGIGAVLFMVWYLTFKGTQKQFEFALKQNQEQFEKSLVQIEKQHKENLELNQKTIDRLIDMMKKENEYKEILTGVLTEMKNALTTHINEHGRD